MHTKTAHTLSTSTTSANLYKDSLSSSTAHYFWKFVSYTRQQNNCLWYNHTYKLHVNAHTNVEMMDVYMCTAYIMQNMKMIVFL